MLQKIVKIVALCCCMVFVLVQSPNVRAQGPGVVGTDALWQPGMEGMRDIKDECESAPNFGNCFAANMQRQGASPQAIAFTKLIGNTGFMRDFRETGRVDVGYVNYPYRANENQGCLLVNGSPREVEEEAISLLPKNDLEKTIQYIALTQKYPNISIFPGVRSGTGYPVLQGLPGGGQRFVVAYKLMNGCHACEQLATVHYAFDFNNKGRFLGTKFQSIDQ